MALGLLADVAESTWQHDTITASLAIAPARRMEIGSWHWACWPRWLGAPGSTTPSLHRIPGVLTRIVEHATRGSNPAQFIIPGDM